MTAMASALVSAGVPAAVAAANERALTSPATSHQDATLPAYTIPGLTDASPAGYQSAVYRDTLRACEAAASGMINAIAYMCVWSRNVAPVECVTNAKGPTAQAFWKRGDVGEVVEAMAKGLRVEKATARKYLRVAVGYAHHADYDAAVGECHRLGDVVVAVGEWMDNGGHGNIRDMAECVGVVWSTAKPKREATPYGEDPTLREATDAEREAEAKAVERKVKAAQGLDNAAKAQIITYEAMVAYIKGLDIPADKAQAFKGLAALINARVDECEAAREAADTSHQDATSQDAETVAA